mmetsp:Transcript_15631/g.19832  ORF Transcript_15631/g.19832 Transcript_15631/m.19832 type:complete len:99 (-) Transcript_15631:474-770(-)
MIALNYTLKVIQRVQILRIIQSQFQIRWHKVALTSSLPSSYSLEALTNSYKSRLLAVANLFPLLTLANSPRHSDELDGYTAVGLEIGSQVMAVENNLS